MLSSDKQEIERIVRDHLPGRDRTGIRLLIQDALERFLAAIRLRDERERGMNAEEETLP